jgi:hypothetical protein
MPLAESIDALRPYPHTSSANAHASRGVPIISLHAADLSDQRLQPLHAA